MGHKVSVDKECMMKGFFPHILHFSFLISRDTRKPTVALSAVGKWKDSLSPTHQSLYLCNVHSFIYCFYFVTFPLYNSWSLSGEVEQTESLLFGVKSWWWCQNLGQEGDCYLLHHDYIIIIGISYQLINLSLSGNLSSYRSVLQKPNTAVEYVAAHLSKIHGLDWHPDNEYILATSSQDNSVRVIMIIIDHIVHILLFCCSLTYTWFCVYIDLLQKFWDYRQPRKYLDILSCQVPVWKARYTVQFEPLFKCSV